MAKKDPSAMVELVLDRRGADEAAPDIALYHVSPAGQPVDKLARAADEKLELQRKWLKLEGTVAFGPDVEDVGDLQVESLIQFRLHEKWDEWHKVGIIALPRPWWEGWLGRRVCVSGSARWCRRWSILADDRIRLNSDLFARPQPLPRRQPAFARGLPRAPHAQIRPEMLELRHPRFHFCRPLCHGVVEIYERTCCCRPWVVRDPRLDELLDRLREIVCGPLPCPPDPWRGEPLPEEPELLDPPGGPVPPGPFPPVAGMHELPRDTARLQKRIGAFTDPAKVSMPSQRLSEDFQALRAFPAARREEADRYVMARPYLWPLLCSCSMRKVGEATVNPDGSFSVCYWRPLRVRRWGVNCHTSYGFKIKQWHENQWITIYDGLGLHEYFDADDDIVLESHDPRARSCDVNPPPFGYPKPFVLLEDVGATRTHRLVSPPQNAADGLATALPGNAGLLDPPGAGESADGKLLNRPWSMTLPLRLYVDPAMESLGAHYYRFSVVAADANGNPASGATPQPLIDPVSWKKYVHVGGQVQVQGESLGPNSVVDPNGDVQAGLFLIPYWDAAHKWLYGQFHQRWNTLEQANGRYLLILEIFDAAGNRLRPTGAGGAGVDKNFDFLRWTDPVNTTKVDFASVVHVFWLDKQACYGDIEDLRMDGLASTKECQFMTGTASSTFSSGFRAFHANGPAGETFMWHYKLWYHRGLNGPDRDIEIGGTNAPPTLLAGNAAESTPQTFGSMLDAHPKCTFALNLRVRAKHTNGSRRISEYDRADQAAFALEVLGTGTTP